uniref:Uncharacterized protein n=1 Tax=Sander lucioperca TaxID=283035 RepID=A0A8C9YMZ3_SANLU
MKPPPRKRTKIDRTLYPEPASGKQASSSSQWKQAEQRSLLTALKKLSGKTQGHEDIDYDFLRNHVQTRSISEVTQRYSIYQQSISKRLEEKVRKPIEVWTHMASTITGNLEEPISTAFSQVLSPRSNTPTPISTATTSNSLSSSNATSQTPVPSTAASTGASSTPPLSTTAAALYARFGRTSKYNTTDTPRVLGVKSVVDFERIYCYLSQIHQPNDECHLTPMESAIMLDLLMSLPEELRLLNCNKLHTHLTQVHLAAHNWLLIKRKEMERCKNKFCWDHINLYQGHSTSGIAPLPAEIWPDVLLFGRMSVAFLFLCVGVLNSGGFLRTMVNCSSDLCRVNPDS